MSKSASSTSPSALRNAPAMPCSESKKVKSENLELVGGNPARSITRFSNPDVDPRDVRFEFIAYSLGWRRLLVQAAVREAITTWAGRDHRDPPSLSKAVRKHIHKTLHPAGIKYLPDYTENITTIASRSMRAII